MPSEEDAIDKFMDVSSAYLLRRWLPIGTIRKIIFFGLLVFFALGVLTELQWYHWLAVISASVMSPRLLAEASYIVGWLCGTFSRG